MPSEGSAKARRAPGRKSRIGCRGCKVCRVKCDETRPFCLRCRNFGIRCDGYPPQLKVFSEAPELLPKPSMSSSMPIELSTLSLNNDEEAKYFAFFCNKTSPEITPFFPSSTRQCILQACNNVAIRHGVIAIAALHKASIIAQNNNLRTGQEAAVKHHTFAIEQYSKAVKHMHSATNSGEQDFRTAMISCLVIVCFEAYHGNFDLAYEQIKIGLSLIAGWMKQYPASSQDPLGFSSPAPAIIGTELLQRLSQLEIQTLSFLDRRSMDEHDALRERGDEILRDMPSPFSSTQEAQIYLHLIIRRCQHFSQVWGALLEKLRVNASLKESRPALKMLTTFSDAFQNLQDGSLSKDVLFQEALNEHGARLDELMRWKDMFDLFQDRETQQEPSAGVLMLKLYFKSAYIALGAGTPHPSTSYDDLNDTMEEMVADSERVLDLLSEDEAFCAFSLEIGVVIPLYMVGLKCRVSATRDRVKKLLLSRPRREGIWDSVFVGKIIQWIQRIEEEFLEDGNVPLWGRVGNVAMDLDLHRRKAELVCWQQVSTDSFEKTRRRTVITW